ncbi:NADP-dependent malic enzyme [Burkholderia sp. AU4i]|nr:NADP-dependent malic enzyme [Burkholderia sp. AU4i]
MSVEMASNFPDRGVISAQSSPIPSVDARAPCAARRVKKRSISENSERAAGTAGDPERLKERHCTRRTAALLHHPDHFCRGCCTRIAGLAADDWRYNAVEQLF